MEPIVVFPFARFGQAVGFVTVFRSSGKNAASACLL
jgi:hypothetical protein